MSSLNYLKDLKLISNLSCYYTDDFKEIYLTSLDNYHLDKQLKTAVECSISNSTKLFNRIDFHDSEGKLKFKIKFTNEEFDETDLDRRNIFIKCDKISDSWMRLLNFNNDNIVDLISASNFINSESVEEFEPVVSADNAISFINKDKMPEVYSRALEELMISLKLSICRKTRTFLPGHKYINDKGKKFIYLTSLYMNIPRTMKISNYFSYLMREQQPVMDVSEMAPVHLIIDERLDCDNYTKLVNKCKTVTDVFKNSYLSSNFESWTGITYTDQYSLKGYYLDLGVVLDNDISEDFSIVPYQTDLIRNLINETKTSSYREIFTCFKLFNDIETGVHTITDEQKELVCNHLRKIIKETVIFTSEDFLIEGLTREEIRLKMLTRLDDFRCEDIHTLETIKNSGFNFSEFISDECEKELARYKEALKSFDTWKDYCSDTNYKSSINYYIMYVELMEDGPLTEKTEIYRTSYLRQSEYTHLKNTHQVLTDVFKDFLLEFESAGDNMQYILKLKRLYGNVRLKKKFYQRVGVDVTIFDLIKYAENKKMDVKTIKTLKNEAILNKILVLQGRYLRLA